MPSSWTPVASSPSSAVTGVRPIAIRTQSSDVSLSPLASLEAGTRSGGGRVRSRAVRSCAVQRRIAGTQGLPTRRHGARTVEGTAQSNSFPKSPCHELPLWERRGPVQRLGLRAWPSACPKRRPSRRRPPGSEIMVSDSPLSGVLLDGHCLRVGEELRARARDLGVDDLLSGSKKQLSRLPVSGPSSRR